MTYLFSKPVLLALALTLSACNASEASSPQTPVTPASADKAGPQAPFIPSTEYGEAILAGGCFWCVESDFEKLDGVIEAISGYAGGTLDNPTYDDVTAKGSGHYEVAKIVYDPAKISYSELLEYFWTHVDPTDAGGQFCDRGESYRTAVFATPEQIDAARKSKADLEASGRLQKPVVTPILPAVTFYEAEDYHQDFYKKSSLRYNFYRKSCGRDATIARVWGK